jgi:hypothetical protein
LLLVGDATREQLRHALAERVQGAARVHVVAPTVVRPLDWLATAEDEAHRQAEIRAFEAEWTLADQVEVAVEGEAGDVDPVQAVEDALTSFPADEILITGASAELDLEQAVRRFGLPVSRLGGAPPTHRSRAYRALRELAGGHTGATPFVLFVGVNGALLLLGAALSTLALLVLWLLGAL